MTYLGTAVRKILDITERTQSDLAEKMGYSPSYLNKVLKGHPVSPEVFRQLIGAWEDDKLASEIMIAHLKDEIHRASLDPNNFNIRYKGSQNELSIESKLEFLELASGNNQTLREKIEFFYELARDSQYQTEAVAEDPPAGKPKKKIDMPIIDPAAQKPKRKQYKQK